jgi:hypothetical protein
MKGFDLPTSTFGGQKKKKKGGSGKPTFRHRRDGSVTVRNEHGWNKTKHNTEYEMTKTKQWGSWQYTQINLLLPTAEKKIPPIFENFRDISNFYLLFQDFSRDP